METTLSEKHTNFLRPTEPANLSETMVFGRRIISDPSRFVVRSGRPLCPVARFCARVLIEQLDHVMADRNREANGTREAKSLRHSNFGSDFRLSRLNELFHSENEWSLI
jgi:hypothetical protein